MSSPKMTTMFGLSFCAMLTSLSMVRPRVPLPPSHCAQEHRAEGEETDEDHGDRDDVDRRLDRSLRHPSDGMEVAAPQIGEHRPILMPRDEQREDAGSDQREPEIARRFGQEGWPD